MTFHFLHLIYPPPATDEDKCKVSNFKFSFLHFSLLGDIIVSFELRTSAQFNIISNAFYSSWIQSMHKIIKAMFNNFSSVF